jgi:hypothetical protein
MKLTIVIDKVELIRLVTQGKQPPWLYLRSYDPDGENGRGYVRMTDQLDKAKRFPDLAAVFEEWKRQSTTVPFRDDGKPNRPLTAYTMEPVEISIT